MLEEIIAVLNDITGADAGEITPETELFEEGLLDSFGLVELLVRLEQFGKTLDVAELRMILARLDAAEQESDRGELDKQLHQKIAQIADNPMLYSVLTAADQLTESIISGTRSYIMKKKQSAREVDDQHQRLVEAIVAGNVTEAEMCMSEHMETIEKYMEEMQKEQG